jgi:hypothetical protein
VALLERALDIDAMGPPHVKSLPQVIASPPHVRSMKARGREQCLHREHRSLWSMTALAATRGNMDPTFALKVTPQTTTSFPCHRRRHQLSLAIADDINFVLPLKGQANSSS